MVFMDDGSKASMITQSLAMRLGLKEERMDQLMEVLGRAKDPVSGVYELHPHLKKGALDRPVGEIVIVIGQDVDKFLPSGGDDP